MNTAQLLATRAAQTPHRIALIDESTRRTRTLTFAELDAAAATAAGAFIDSGLKPGDRVAVLHTMSIELYVALAGLLYAGCVPTICDPSAGRRHVAQCYTRATPRAVFGSTAGLLYSATFRALAGARRFSPSDLRRSRRGGEIVARSGDDAAIVTFTSGSTASPKVVVRSHAVMKAQLDAIHSLFPLDGIDVTTMPIALLANLASGVTSVIPGIDLRRPGSADAERLAADIARHSAMSIVASPALLERLIRVSHVGRLGTLRRIVTGGAPVMPTLVAALREAIPQAKVVCVYGSTEAEPIARLSHDEITTADIDAMRTGSGLLAGRPVPDVMVRIIDGEICVAGPHVVESYLDGTGNAEAKLRIDGRTYHRTGDAGYFDPSGRLWLLGRSVARIRDDRGTLEPFAVECALSFNHGIARTALASYEGTRVVVVQARERARLDQASLLQSLAWASIDRIELARIPVDRRHNAKVDYPALGRLLRTSAR